MIPRQDMPRQDPKKRVTNFDEVALGYTEEQAVKEASRCLGCKKPVCIRGCPVEIDIHTFIAMIKDRDFLAAAHKLKEKNSLPAICGRVCPQESQCEQECVLGKKNEPVAIGRLERFAADYEAQHGEIIPPPTGSKQSGKIAIVGSGPAGLTIAGDMAKLGYTVTVFEALHKAGGVLTYGIPEFRLPKSIVQREVEYIRMLGAEIKTNIIIGCTLTVDDIFAIGYDAIFLGNGAGLPLFLRIPGENLNGVYSANEYLTRSNLMKAYLFPKYSTPIKKSKRVAVVGGGNVAMDCTRTALRLGADEVIDIYRRSREEMPARVEEIENAEEEGVNMKFLTTPVRIIGDSQYSVRAVECLRMKLGEPDASGRRRPLPIEGSEFTLPIDIIIIAIGNGANPLVASSTPELETNKWGYIVADEETGQTSREGIFAGGDIVTGSATVISAMGAARHSAKAIHKYLSNR